MLLDDVMSELDPERREPAGRRRLDGAGQALLTATETEHVPGGAGARRIAVRDGAADGARGGGRDVP